MKMLSDKMPMKGSTKTWFCQGRHFYCTSWFIIFSTSKELFSYYKDQTTSNTWQVTLEKCRLCPNLHNRHTNNGITYNLNPYLRYQNTKARRRTFRSKRRKNPCCCWRNPHQRRVSLLAAGRCDDGGLSFIFHQSKQNLSASFQGTSQLVSSTVS